MALPIPPVPPPEDLLRLAEAALANAGDLLADARLLAEAGSFPRAHALATLACEELGKAEHCICFTWLPCTPKIFWDGFVNHTKKLYSAQGHLALKTGEPIGSNHLFNERVHHESRSAHGRKMRGLYVDYSDGALQLPGEITEQETRQRIDVAQMVLDHSKTSWAAYVGGVNRCPGCLSSIAASWPYLAGGLWTPTRTCC